MRLIVTMKSWPGSGTTSSLAQLSWPLLPSMLLLQTLISTDRWAAVREALWTPMLRPLTRPLLSSGQGCDSASLSNQGQEVTVWTSHKGPPHPAAELSGPGTPSGPLRV